MKRSRACEDLVALAKRNKTDDVNVHEFAMAVHGHSSLLTRSASAEEELSRLLEANAVASFDRLSNELALSFDDVDDDCFLAHRGSPRVDTRAVSLREKDARDAKDAIQFKKSINFHTHSHVHAHAHTHTHAHHRHRSHHPHSAVLLHNSPDSPESHLFQHYASLDATVFDMSAITMVLERHAV